MQRRIVGSVAGVACTMAFGAILLSIRSNIDVSTAGLVLVIPVVVGAVVGGFFAGTVSVVTGFLVYDFWFVPPYGTLTVGTTQNWTALVVYAAVMLLVVRVVTGLDSARLAARRGDETMRRLSDLSEQLVGDQPVEDLLKIIVDTAHHVFGVSGVSLLVLHEERLFVAASAGEELTLQELHRLEPGSGLTVSVGTANISSSSLRTIALSASGRPIGILAMRGLPESSIERAVLTTFANDAALAIERAQLREQALRSQLLEQVDRLRRGLMGAVSHDLRTPLATIKVASSTLSNDAGTLSGAEMRELYFLIEIEADRLTRLVTNLLDMTRIESGVLRAKQCPAPVSELVDDALAVLGPSLGADAVKVSLCGSLPSVNVDRLLVVQVLINLLDNAARHAPPDSVIEVTADLRAGKVVVAVEDAGTGVAIGDREAVFDRFAQFDTGGRAGLGLTIARTFVEAHGERIWCEGSKYGGARFAFSLPAVLDDSSRG